MPTPTDVALTGLTAKVSIGTTDIAYISGVDLTMEKSIIEVLSFGNRYKEKVPAINDWSATVDGTAAFAAGATQNQLLDAYDDDTLVTLKVYLNETTYFEGTAYISSINLSGAPDDKMSISAEFAGSGAMTHTIPTV